MDELIIEVTAEEHAAFSAAAKASGCETVEEWCKDRLIEACEHEAELDVDDEES